MGDRGEDGNFMMTRALSLWVLPFDCVMPVQKARGVQCAFDRVMYVHKRGKVLGGVQSGGFSNQYVVLCAE